MNKVLKSLIERYPELETVQNSIQAAADALIRSYENGGKLLVCGNGGSCADSDHIVGELMKSFEGNRPLKDNIQQKLKEISPERGEMLGKSLQQGLPAISLTVHSALITAVANDINADVIFAQQVTGYGNEGDVLLGISSSGNSLNVIDAMIVAKAKGLATIGLTGEAGGKMREYSDVLINVPGKRTAFVQEFQFPVYHALCMMVENHFFNT